MRMEQNVRVEMLLNVIEYSIYMLSLVFAVRFESLRLFVAHVHIVLWRRHGVSE